MLNTWEATVKFLVPIGTKTVLPIEIAQFLGWTTLASAAASEPQLFPPSARLLAVGSVDR
jgi:hypothetical protein